MNMLVNMTHFIEQMNHASVNANTHQTCKLPESSCFYKVLQSCYLDFVPANLSDKQDRAKKLAVTLCC